jgi:hypothetical protein
MNNFYNLTLFKIHSMSEIFKNNKDSINRTQFSEEFSYSSLMENLNLKKVSFTMDENVSLAFDENQFNDFVNHLDNKYPTMFNSELSKKICKIKDTNLKNYHVTSTEDMINSKNNAKQNPASQDKIRNHELLKIEKQKKIESLFNLDFDYKNKKICSFDFEFRPDVLDKFKFEHVFEVGISIQDGSNIKSYHYIVEENSNQKEGNKRELQNSFDFGKSEYVSFNQLNSIIQNHVDNTDLLVVHEHSNDLKIFDLNDIKYDIKNVKDTQYIYLKHFIKDENYQSKTLKKLLDDHNIIHKNLHNAGNDSRFTLMLFKSMCKNHQLLQRKNSLKNS